MMTIKKSDGPAAENAAKTAEPGAVAAATEVTARRATTVNVPDAIEMNDPTLSPAEAVEQALRG